MFSHLSGRPFFQPLGLFKHSRRTGRWRKSAMVSVSIALTTSCLTYYRLFCKLICYISKCLVKICVAKRTSLIATSDISMGEKGFQEMTFSAEEVIDIYPNMFNFYQEFGCHYDISEAHQILWSLGILDEEFHFHELVISSSRVLSLQGQDDLMTVLCGIYDAKETRVGHYTCGGYIFTTGCRNDHYFIMDTHCLRKELSGNRIGLLKVFFSTEGELESEHCWLCNWILTRLQLVMSKVSPAILSRSKDSKFGFLCFYFPRYFHDSLKFGKQAPCAILFCFNLLIFRTENF